MHINRFHNSWVGSRLSVRQWLALFVHYYNFNDHIKRLIDEHRPRKLSRQFQIGLLVALLNEPLAFLLSGSFNDFFKEIGKFAVFRDGVQRRIFNIHNMFDNPIFVS